MLFVRLLFQGKLKRVSGKVPQKEYPARYHKKRIQRGSMKIESGKIPLDMSQATKAGPGGRSSNSRRGGKGCRRCDNTMPKSVPIKASEVGACKDLKGDVFTIGSGSKGKD